jgi:N-acetylglucosaminyl-diphospho-decaprenol L-rhamnosyltransferase
MPTRLLVSVVTHNESHILGRCLDSIRAAGGDVDLRIVIADSASSDDVESVAERYGATFLPGPDRGYGAAQNRVLEHTAGQSDYTLAINADIEVQGGRLRDLLEFADAHPDVGVVVPRLVDEHGVAVSPMVNHVSGFRSLALARAPLLHWVAARTAGANGDGFDFVPGPFMMLRTSAFKDCGGFDPGFFLYWEEVDLCLRLQRAGWRIALCDAVTVMHETGERLTSEPPEFIDSLLRFTGKWATPSEQRLMRLCVVAAEAREVARLRSTGPARRNSWARLVRAMRGAER